MESENQSLKGSVETAIKDYIPRLAAAMGKEIGNYSDIRYVLEQLEESIMEFKQENRNY